MARLKVHYEGWLALPPDMRQKLGVATGGELEAELVEGTIVLRPAEAKVSLRREAEKADAATAAATAVAAPPALAVVNKEAEPAPAPAPAPVSLAPPATAKRRGRPPKVRQPA
jgi:bifunctional DNA-binding transcriptional regulator/antitoxin component of YhaV-PrlF toxin-antitoxin module